MLTGKILMIGCPQALFVFSLLIGSHLQEYQVGRSDTKDDFHIGHHGYHPRGTRQCIEGSMIANETDCSIYHECVGGRYELRLCPYLKLFDPQSQCCKSDYVCPYSTAMNLQTETCTIGETRSIETDCRAYLECVGSPPHFERRICADGQIFSRDSKMCIPGGYGAGNGIIYNTAADGINTDSVECQESSTSSGYRADPNNPRAYYQCANGKWVHKNCPANLEWNSLAVVCDWPKHLVMNEQRQGCPTVRC
ncbi:hypothetical protein AB6A40_008859 [Gnathostoma spinigerum]|uniref:Chitin-binding type-2 domain-containing protein n=1 Tax=Gnathostoma spinigerum TaxID=75299 RepID=A0ABD6ERH3_9BILA